MFSACNQEGHLLPSRWLDFKKLDAELFVGFKLLSCFVWLRRKLRGVLPSMSNCNHACCRNTQLDDEDEGISKVEIVEDDEDDSRDQVLQDQFNLFAMAMALDDDDMAEQAIQGFGYNLILLQTICLFEKWSLSIGPRCILQHAVHHSQRPLINRLSVGCQQSFFDSTINFPAVHKAGVEEVIFLHSA
jgi:hypothetical protein